VSSGGFDQTDSSLLLLVTNQTLDLLLQSFLVLFRLLLLQLQLLVTFDDTHLHLVGLGTAEHHLLDVTVDL
jgi:hypothetical protein